MINLINSQGFASVALRTAAAACCPARLQAKAFVHAASTAAAARKTRRNQNKQQEQQQTLSNSLSPRASQATVAAQAAQLSTWTAASALSPGQGATPLLTLARQIAEQLGLNGQLRSNRRYRGSISLETGLKLMWNSLNSHHTGLWEKAEADQEAFLEPDRRQGPGYLGQYPVMLAHAARHNGSLTPEQARDYLINDPDCKYILEDMGITADDLRCHWVVPLLEKQPAR